MTLTLNLLQITTISHYIPFKVDWWWIGIMSLLAWSLPGCRDAVRIDAGGASFVFPVMLKWVRCYDSQNNVEVDYTPTGSGNGVAQMLAGRLAFGCTDAFLSDRLLADAEVKHRRILHIPLVLGAVVPIYHVPEAGPKPLRFSGEVLARIFTGDITRWDDPELSALNPSRALPHAGIAVVSRSDPSGTTALFTAYLQQSSRAWATQVGQGMSVPWPVGVSQRGNSGVAGQVRRTPYSIGFVELLYAQRNQLAVGAVETYDSAQRNHAARQQMGMDLPMTARSFLLATPATVTAACRSALPEIRLKHRDLRFRLLRKPGPAYPIVGVDWAVLYAQQPSEIGQALQQFLLWVTRPDGEAQQMAADLGYTPLPAELLPLIDAQIGQMTWQ